VEDVSLKGPNPAHYGRLEKRGEERRRRVSKGGNRPCV